MLRTRLWMGAVLIALVAGVLFGDQSLSPWHPFLLAVVLVLSLLACHELLHLFPAHCRPPGWLCYSSVAALVVTNWLPAAWGRGAEPLDPWKWLASVFAGIVIVAFMVAMATYRPALEPAFGVHSSYPNPEQGPSSPTLPAGVVGMPEELMARLGLTVLLAAYLGLLPSFLVQLRWSGFGESPAAERRATAALALAIFVPKCCDIGAYFTGRFLGRHKMAPVLSPKKTWEGAAGGIAASVVASYGIDRSLGPVLPEATLATLGFGAVIGATGIMGDLAESFLKRACLRKDASTMMPGFGGVLDVVDSILFSAPVAYWWLH